MIIHSRHSIRLTFFLIAGMFSLAAYGQQYSLFGHFHDFPGYYNPALNKGGTYSEIGLVHRSQWTDLGYPTVNTLFFKYPPQLDLPVLNFRSVGLIVQNESYSFLNRTSVQVFTANTLVGNRYYSLNTGINAGLYMDGFNTDDLNVKELADPQMGLAENQVVFRGRFGVSFDYEKFQLGVATGLKSTEIFDDLTATISNQFDLGHSKFGIVPAVIYRVTKAADSQFEVQLRTIYDRKVAFTAGYRQEYGALFQLSLLINRIKGSYGNEIPQGDRSALGLTHEILMTYRFKLVNAKKQEEEANLRQKRDSLNAARLDSIRRARLLMYQTKNESKEDTAQADHQSEDKSDSLAVTETSEFEQISGSEKVISFDDIPIHIEEDNTRVVLRHIGFEVGYDILKPYAYKELDKLVTYLKHNKHFKIEVQGHTDNQGSADVNYELSYRRALTVFNYLISRGIASNKMKVVGYGEDRPLYRNDTEEHRELNRRIEIVFLKD